MSCDAGPVGCVRKHVESNDTYYIDLAPKLGTNETVSSVTSITCSDAALTAAAADRKSTRLNSSHVSESRMPSSA